MKYWSLREELYRTFHQWPTMMLFFIIGSLLGWGLSALFPPTFKATSKIFVALNPYRAYTDSNFVSLAKPKYSNLDDYKNWQMSELESLIFLEEVLDTTLNRLQSNSPEWEKITNDQLLEMLEAEWRSAGTWSLVARGSDAELAEQAARVWSETAVERVNKASASALRTFMIDEELIETISIKTEAEARLRTISAIRDDMLEWANQIEQSGTNQVLTLAERWQVESFAAAAADFSPGWQNLLDQQPSEEAPAVDYLDWITKIQVYIEQETTILEEEISDLESKQGQLEGQYKSEFQKSKGISPNLVVEEINHQPASALRPSRLFALVGGMVGFFLFILVRLVIIARDISRQ